MLKCLDRIIINEDSRKRHRTPQQGGDHIKKQYRTEASFTDTSREISSRLSDLDMVTAHWTGRADTQSLCETIWSVCIDFHSTICNI